MDIDVEALLVPIDGDAPTGPDLAYDNARYSLETAFDQSVSIDSDGAAPEAPDIDWGDIVDQIVDQFGRTKDIWLAVYLARAGAKAGRLDVVQAGVQALAGLFDRYWDGVHPQMEEVGAPGRKTPCDSLSSRGAFLNALMATPLIRHQRLGSFSGADLERFRSGGEAEDGYGFFRATLEEVGAEGLTAVEQQLDAIDSALREADKLFMEKAPGEVSPNFHEAYEALATLKRSVRAFSGGGEPGADAATTAEEEGSGGVSAGGGGGGPRIAGRVDSREDVIRAIDAICDYYRRREPGSPVPLVLERARAWVTLDFIQLLRDIAPDSVRDVTQVLMRRPDDE